MTNNQVLTLAVGLAKVNPPDMSGDFNYAISANLQEAQRISKDIRAAIQDSPEVKEFKEQLKKLQEEYAALDDEGQPSKIVIPLPNGTSLLQYDIPSAADPASDFNTKLNALNEKYKKDLDKQNKKLEFLNKENKEFKPILIDRKDLPNGLPRDQMDLIFPLIKKK